MKNKKYFYISLFLSVFVILATASLTYADNGNRGRQAGEKNDKTRNWQNAGLARPAVFGIVSAINGNTLTIASRQKENENNSSSVSFSVDATNAKILKNSTAGTLTSIAVGDNVAVFGTVSGTNIVATEIHDGIMRGTGTANRSERTQNPPMTGNGQPVVVGTVSSLSGSTISITNKSGVSYSVDATNAKITQGPNTISYSNIVVGDMLVVQGTVNGNSIVASSIMDRTVQANTNTAPNANATQHRGFFGTIGSFFAHLFGY